MKFYKLAFFYSAFNQGYSITSPVKWVMAIFGIGAAIQNYNLIWIILGSVIYFFLCFIIGILCYKYGWIDAIQEVSNRYNPLAKEIRNSKIFK